MNTLLLSLLIILFLILALSYKTYSGGAVSLCDAIILKYNVWPYESTIIVKDSMKYNMMSGYVNNGLMYFNPDTNRFVYQLGNSCINNIENMKMGVKIPVSINIQTFIQFAKEAKETTYSKRDIAKLSGALVELYAENKYRAEKCNFTLEDINTLLYPQYETDLKAADSKNSVEELKASILNINTKLADISERKKYASIIDEGNKIIKLLSEVTK